MSSITVEPVPIVDLVLVGTFGVLAVSAALRAPRLGSAAGWVAGAFGAVAASLAAFTLPEQLDVEIPDAAARVLIALLLAFPYLLLRFTASFAPLPAGRARAAAAGFAGVAVVTIALPVVPEPGAALPLWTPLYVAFVLSYWLLTSVGVVRRLWAAGRGQPSVARIRMRLMAVATSWLTVALLLSAPLGEDGGATGILIRLSVLASAVAFGLGLRPPASVRLRWRRPEEAQLREGTVAVLRAGDVQAVADALLPPTVRIITARGAALYDADGELVATHGDVPTGPDRESARADLPLPDGRGHLVVWTSPYTPFFGPEEIGLLQTMVAVAGLALERCELLEDERRRREEMEQAQAALLLAQEEADRANQAKSAFLSRTSHELRTPLNAILGFGQVLEGVEALGDRDSQAVDHILRAGRHLLRLIDELLDLSRIETDSLSLVLEPVEVVAALDEAVGLVHPLARSRGIEVTVDRSSCDGKGLADPQRLRQILLNLLSNAVKYTPAGGHVEAWCELRDTGVRVLVRDTGPGIPEDRQWRLFEPFDRLGAEGTGVEGTGLGLALSRQLAERMGGTIGVDSAPGAGSTFFLELPIADGRQASTTTAVSTPGHPVSGPPQTLLLVEDALSNLEVVTAMLERRPAIRVVPADRGGQALHLATEQPPDVVVLDLHLPDVSGREILRRLRQDPRTTDVPVVVATADATPGLADALLAEGAYAYLTKPLDMAAFLEVVDEALAVPRRPRPPEG